MLIHQMLRRSTERFYDKRALWFKNEWMDYATLDRLSDTVSVWLCENGICQGERVAILLENSFDYVISYYGILKAGGVVVAMNTANTSTMAQYQLNHSDAVALITSERFHSVIEPILCSVPTLKVIITDSVDSFSSVRDLHVSQLQWVYQNVPPRILPIRTIDVDLSAIVYTSGSTGTPKGVMLSHLNTVANTNSIVQYLELTSNDRILVVLPFYYVYGKTLLNTHIAVGGSVVLCSGFTFFNVVLTTAQELEVTGFAGVPSTYMILLSKSSVRKYSFPSLRYVTQAGGGMAPNIQKEVAEVFSPAKLYVMYGATELSPRLTYLPPHMLERKLGSIGIPVPNTRAYVVDDLGNEVGPNIEGNIVGAGSNVMIGYWKDPQGSAQVIRNGVYYTGDRGIIDDDGYLYVVGRTSDMLKVGGNRVSAKEIEDALLEIEAVEEAAVIKIDDAILGEAAKAFIVLKKGRLILTEYAIKQQLQLKLPSYKIPKKFQFVSELPKNESGKIIKAQLATEGFNV